MIYLVPNLVSLLETLTYPVLPSIREDYEEDTVTYPRIIVSEIVNIPNSIGTTSDGNLKEQASSLSFQVDIQTQDAVDDEGTVLDKKTLGVDILSICDAALFGEYNLIRKSITRLTLDTSTLRTIVRYDNIMTDDNIAYRG